MTLIWEDPPTRKSRVMWIEEATELRSQPCKWARITERPTTVAAENMASGIPVVPTWPLFIRAGRMTHAPRGRLCGLFTSETDTCRQTPERIPPTVANHVDPFAPGYNRSLDLIEWAIPDKHVAALNVVARYARDADELCKFADMLGFGTEEMRTRYEQGVELRRSSRTTT